ncbi:hypothetical protein H5410_042300 [Solanum commersonii]|uniref:Uncharacterized protein n=1 Tax=Solanum commersonii TaxID=4109 RepID=A0A9J5XVM2_SOLCO|nr:hypothetical protein H5410_042300 [Solanum commersonii]
MAEVKNLLLERRKLISSPTTINDLKQEIDNPKEDIRHLKEKNVIIEITLLIDYNYKKEFIALIDSAADLNCIKEGLISSSFIT